MNLSAKTVSVNRVLGPQAPELRLTRTTASSAAEVNDFGRDGRSVESRN